MKGVYIICKTALLLIVYIAYKNVFVKPFLHSSIKSTS